MARISLRAYNAEIEALIENEKTDEAAAHCRHILAIFPKHIHTYRLLGKAYLENRQHTEALDVFERLLTAVPDDFIAHLGMSIIREEEGNLDAAIWHMERAFELQPYNSAIQDEMRRLYGRRDGAEPVKIRLTRGALARMYARGNLYEQAVAEIRQVLANEPQRPDMQVLLAQMYEKMEKPVQAAEVCSRLLKQYPYCLEANRILAHVLGNSKRSEEAQTYQERLQALDPYYAYLNPQAPTLADIPDEAVQLEKMDSAAAEMLPVQRESGWLTTIGVEETALTTTQEEELPAWLTGEEESSEQEASVVSDSLAEAPAPEEESIPDWMKAAGWGPDSGEFDESALSLESLEETPAEAAEEEAAPAELPDWLQEIAPPEVATGMLTMPEEERGEEEDQALAALIDTGGLGPLPEREEGAAQEMPDWLEEMAEETTEVGQLTTEEAVPAEEIPDWLEEMAEETTDVGQPTTAEAAPAEEIPDWLEEIAEETTEVGQLTTEEAVPAEEIPEWLEEMAEETTEVGQLTTAEAVPAEEIPDWLAEATVDRGPESAEKPTEPSSVVPGPSSIEETTEVGQLTTEEAVPAEEIPDWLAEAAGDRGPEAGEEPAEPSSVVPGLSSIEETTDIGQPTTEEAVPAEEIPDWLAEATIDRGPESAEEPAEPSSVVPGLSSTEETTDVGQLTTEEAVPAEEIPDWLAEATGDRGPEAGEAPSEDMDAAMAWLESLAAKQGVSEEELLTAPEERPEEAPEWVTEMAAEETTEVGQPTTEEAAEPPSTVHRPPSEEKPTEPSSVVPGPSSTEETTDIGQQPTEEAVPAEEIPDWLAEATGDRGPETGEAPSEDMDAAMAWLESLAAKQGVSEEELLTAPEERPEEAPEWVTEMAAEETTEVGQLTTEEAIPAEEIPEWLEKMAVDRGPEAAEEPAEPSSVVPGPSSTEETTEVGQPTTAEAVPAEEIPDWLEEIAEETTDVGQPTTEEPAEPPSTVHRPPSEEKPTEPSSVVPGPSSIEETPVATGPLPPPPEWVLEGEAPEEEAAAPITWDESGQADIEKLELNQASLVQLERLPGIGFRLAQAITTYREAHGPFRNLQELENVAGIGPMTLSELQNFLYVEAPKAAKRRRSPTGMPLPDAEAALREGDVEEAVRILAPVIHSSGALDEVMHMLKQALRTAPDSLDLWIALGDACMRADRLEEALEAYNRAEEILVSGI